MLHQSVELLELFLELGQLFSPLVSLILLNDTLNGDVFLVLEIFMHQDYIISFMIPLLFEFGEVPFGLIHAPVMRDIDLEVFVSFFHLLLYFG